MENNSVPIFKFIHQLFSNSQRYDGLFVVPTSVILCHVLQPKEMYKIALSPGRVNQKYSVVIFFIIFYRLQEEALLQAVVKVVDHRPFGMLDAARISQGVALIWVQLQWIVAFDLHQSVQELRTVLEVDPRYGKHMRNSSYFRYKFVRI